MHGLSYLKKPLGAEVGIELDDGGGVNAIVEGDVCEGDVCAGDVVELSLAAGVCVR